MITNGKKSHYLAVTNLSALLEKNSSNHHGDFYCLNCFNSYASINKFKEHEEICNNYNSYHIEIPKCAEKILKYNPGEKSLKTICNLSWSRMFIKKKNNPIVIIIIIIIIVSKNHIQKKSQTWAFWLVIVYKIFIW